MNISWTSNDYGRGGELRMLNRKRNDFTIPNYMRTRADKAHQRIVCQLRDKDLMRLRTRLIKAIREHDNIAADKIQRQMRSLENQDKETGL